MAVIVAVVTDEARARWPQMFGGLLAFKDISDFKVGEGGWYNPGTSRERRVPDSALTNLDVIVDLSRAPVDKRYVVPGETFSWFSKSLVPGDFAYVAPRTLEVSCLLDFGDYNDDGSGNNPEIWEIGLFDADGVMVAYGTVPEEIKDASKQIVNVVRIVF